MTFDADSLGATDAPLPRAVPTTFGTGIFGGGTFGKSAAFIPHNDTLWAGLVEFNVRLGVGRPGDAQFTLDHDPNGRLDGPGMLGSPDSPWLDVTCDVRRASWRAGATRTDGVLTRIEAGTCQLVLDNNDGFYDLTDPFTRFQPMVPVSLRARLTDGDGTWTALWTGYADEFDMAWSKDEDETMTVTATDGIKLLSSYDPPEQDPVGAGDTASQRAQRILAEAEWTGPTRITAGGHVMQATTMARDAWTQLLLNQDTELGTTAIAMDGAFVFQPRDVWVTNTNQPPVADWGPSALRYEDVVVSNDDTHYRNIVDAARAGGTQVTVRDQTEVQLRLPHRWGRNDLMFAGDTDVTDWAATVLQTSLDLTPRVDELEVLPQVTNDTTLFDRVLRTRYGDRWSVTVDPPGKPTVLTRLVQVRGWQHDVTPETWRVTFHLSSAFLWTSFTLDGPSNNDRLDIMRLI